MRTARRSAWIGRSGGGAELPERAGIGRILAVYKDTTVSDVAHDDSTQGAMKCLLFVCSSYEHA